MATSPWSTTPRDWLGYAAADLRAAKSLLRASGPSPRHAGWLAEQAAEKALHAALLAANIEPPETHNLNLLRNALPGDWAIHEQFPDLAELSAWFTADVYPGDWARVLDDGAADIVALGEEIAGCVRDELAQRGFEVQ